MSRPQPGQVARITLTRKSSDQTNVYERCIWDHCNGQWVSGECGRLHPEPSMWDVKVEPLVVLDLDDLRGRMVAPPIASELPAWLRTLADSNSKGADTLGSQAARLLADQIEAQTKPPRIPEPGKYGVVLAGVGCFRSEFVNEGKFWRGLDGGASVNWDELVDPELVRPGIDS